MLADEFVTVYHKLHNGDHSRRILPAHWHSGAVLFPLSAQNWLEQGDIIVRGKTDFCLPPLSPDDLFEMFSEIIIVGKIKVYKYGGESLRHVKAISVSDTNSIINKENSGMDNLRIVFQLGDKSYSPEKISKSSGFFAPDTDINIRSFAASDGGFTNGSRIPSRRLELDFNLNTEDERSFLISFFNPKLLLNITAERGGITRYIKGYVSKFDINGMSANVSLVCPDPYFLGEKIKFEMINSVQSTNYPDYVKFLGVGLSITNPGDDDAGFYLGILPGTDTACRINNRTTGKLLEYTEKLEQDIYFEISTVRGNKFIRSNSENVLYNLTIQSELFPLITGNNDIYIMLPDVDSENMELYFEFEPRYLGV